MIEETADYQYYVAVAQKLGTARAIEKARLALCSHILGRDFGESVADFYVRSIRARALRQFMNDHA